MDTISWLLKGDPSIKRMVYKDLLEEELAYQEEGYIQNYLSYFDPKTSFFGYGLYGPKWTSSFYTCLELVQIRIDPNKKEFQQALKRLYQGVWTSNELFKNKASRDVCIIGMLLKMLAYGRFDEKDLTGLVDFILDTQLEDGGWNCRYNKYPKPKTSSLHTSISVLEGIQMYVDMRYKYKVKELLAIRENAHSFILQKNLFRSRRTKEIIHKEMVKLHYPHRWKYDAFRALDYFAHIPLPLDDRMQEAIDSLKDQLKKGYIHRGRQYNGKSFFALEKGSKGRFTTLQALRILKTYDPIFYQAFLTKDFDF
jgi:hypothetical protein